MFVLANSFLGALAAPAPGADRAQLEVRLSEMVDAGRQRWPTVTAEPAGFAEFLGARVDLSRFEVGTTLIAALDELRAEELYLAYACVNGDAHALAEFEHHFMTPVGLGIDGSTASADDVRQLLRERLYTDHDGSPPLLAKYGGRGRLRGWLRTVAVRLARRARGVNNPASPTRAGDSDIEEVPGQASDPELSMLKARYRTEFNAAFKSAINSLGDRDRTLLAMEVIDGLSHDQIAAAYRVHRTTVVRWLARAQETVLDLTREFLARELSVAPGEVDSIIRLVRTQLDITLPRYLRPAFTPPVW